MIVMMLMRGRQEGQVLLHALHALLAVLLGLLALAPSKGRAQINPPPRIPIYDLAIKQVALNRSRAILASSPNPAIATTWESLVRDALFLSNEGSTATRFASAPLGTTELLHQHRAADGASSSVFYVASNGSDLAGNGSATNPFRSLDRALMHVRSTRKQSLLSSGGTSDDKVLIRIGPGRYAYPSTISLTAADSGLTIQALNMSDRPVLSGGIKISNLEWKKAPAGQGNQPLGSPGSSTPVYQAALPPMVDLTNCNKGLLLAVDGVQYTAARYPNANPVHDIFPAGFVHGPNIWAPSKEHGLPSKSVSVPTVSLPFPSSYQTFQQGVSNPELWFKGHTQGSVTSTNASYQVPSGLTGGILVHWDGSVHENVPGFPFRDQWMNYGYEIVGESSTSNGTRLSLGEGGWQGLNSDRNADSSQPFYVYNARGALDVPGEYWIDALTRTLYLIPNNTVLTAQSTIEISQLSTILSIQGTSSQRAMNITLSGLTFTMTRPTFMEPYEKPWSNLAGWSYYRGAAVEITQAENVQIESSSFAWLGGNALLLSDHTNAITVQDCDFAFTGDSAILALGVPQFGAAVQPSFPNATTVQRCLFHDLGLIGKQVAAYSQFMAARTTLDELVAFNLPRAAVNWGDSFVGDNVLARSVLFECVRESADHGAFNSWAREPLLYVDTANNSMLQIAPLENTIIGNIIIAAGGTLSNLDHDDGSLLYNDTLNVLAYAGAKNYLGNQKKATNSLFLFPDLNIMETTCAFSNGPANTTWGEEYSANICILAGETHMGIIKNPSCSPQTLASCTQLHDNIYLLPPSANLSATLYGYATPATFHEAQSQYHLEAGTKLLAGWPTPSEVAEMATNILTEGGAAAVHYLERK